MAPEFRLDNERLAFRFTATLTDRFGESVERLPGPDRLEDWLTVNAVRLGSASATEADLTRAKALREAIHRAGTAVAEGSLPAQSDLLIINELARAGELYPELIAGERQWRTRSDQPVEAALGLIASDAIAVLGDERAQVRTCENEACRGLFVDTSRGQNRRWCSMNTCGNRAKKARFRHQG